MESPDETPPVRPARETRLARRGPYEERRPASRSTRRFFDALGATERVLGVVGRVTTVLLLVGLVAVLASMLLPLLLQG